MAYFAAALVEWFKLNLTFLSLLLCDSDSAGLEPRCLPDWGWGLGWGGRCASASAFPAFAESLQIVGTQNKWHH